MMQRRFILYLAFLLTVLGVSAANFQLMQPRNVVEGRNFALTFRLTDGEANPPALLSLKVASFSTVQRHLRCRVPRL